MSIFNKKKKRYQTMSAEEVMKSYDAIGHCDVCPARDRCKLDTKTCRKEVSDWLNEYVPTKMRYETVKSQKGLYEEFERFKNICEGTYNCTTCKYTKFITVGDHKYRNCFCNYLSERVEVVDD